MGHVRVGCKEIHGSPVAKVFKVTGLVILGIIAAAALAILFGLVIQWLWNSIMPDIFGLPQVTYWQAVGLVVLSHILFGGHGHHGNGSNSHSKSKKSKRFNFEDGDERSWDSFREFWNDFGREAFDRWLTGKGESTPEPE